MNGMIVKKMKTGLVLAALSLAILGVTGCANLQPPAPPPAPAPEEVRTSLEFGGVLVSIYHPDTRTLYLWSGDPRPNVKHPMNCIQIQLSDTPSGTPKSSPCQ
jgi:hypothetical protein